MSWTGLRSMYLGRTTLCSLHRLQTFVSYGSQWFSLPNQLLTRRNMITVAVEGNIGSGKSTLLNFFQRFPAVYTLNEPVELWTNVNKRHNALNLLYEDPARWSFLFNQYAMLSRLKQHQLNTNRSVKMMERSLFSTQHIFVKNSHSRGFLTDLEYDVLMEWFQYLTISQTVKIDLFVYLRASPELCLERIRRRARKEETSLTLEFLKELHDLHEDLFVKRPDGKIQGRILVLDAGHELSEMHEIYTDKKEQILCGCL